MAAKKPSTRPEAEKKKATWLQPYHFQAGKSGNPGGRPKKKPISDRYAEQIEVLAPKEVAAKIGLPPNATMGDVIARRMAIRAVSGNNAVEASREIREAVEGKAPQAMDLRHTGEVTITIIRKSRIKTTEETTA
jgi:Family of unknown function (DUF5681)